MQQGFGNDLGPLVLLHLPCLSPLCPLPHPGLDLCSKAVQVTGLDEAVLENVTKWGSTRGREIFSSPAVGVII